MPESKSRRQFLQTLSSLFAFGLASPLAVNVLSASAQDKAEQLADQVSAKGSYKLSQWTGDNFTLGHELREGKLPDLAIASSSTCDFVIIGGGIAGLTSAFYLRDHDFLLLEQYDELGGQSRGGNYGGIDYSIGAAYISSVEGIVGDLFADLNIKPVTFPVTRNSWYWENRWLKGVEGSEQLSIYKEFKRFGEEAKTIWPKLRSGNFLELNADLQGLDGQLFSDYLKSYDPKFVSLMNSFSMASLCGATNQVSALAGFDLASDMYSEAYVFKGGNPAIARALVEKIDQLGKGRMHRGSFVWQIDLKENGASVIYSDKQGQLHKVDCRHVIVTAPPLVAARIIPLMDDNLRAKLFSLKFGSYLVANFCFEKAVFNGSYDNNVGDSFTFTDFVRAEAPYQASNEYKADMGSVLTCYQPYAPGSAGRPLLLAGNRQEFAGQLLEQFNTLIDGFENSLDELVLTRWGHAMVVYKPSTYKTIDDIHAQKTGPYTLAHNSMQGIACAESAVASARYAANCALGVTNPKGKALN